MKRPSKDDIKATLKVICACIPLYILLNFFPVTEYNAFNLMIIVTMIYITYLFSFPFLQNMNMIKTQWLRNSLGGFIKIIDLVVIAIIISQFSSHINTVHQRSEQSIGDSKPTSDRKMLVRLNNEISELRKEVKGMKTKKERSTVK